MCVGLSLSFLACSTDLYFCFVPVPYCLDYCSLVVESEIREPDSSSSVFFLFFLKIAFVIRGLLCFHTNCKIFCSSSVKNAVGNLIAIALNL